MAQHNLANEQFCNSLHCPYLSKLNEIRQKIYHLFQGYIHHVIVSKSYDSNNPKTLFLPTTTVLHLINCR